LTEGLFPTQDIGSLPKPRWLVRGLRRGKVGEGELEEAREWGDRLRVPEWESLVGLLREGDLKEKARELRDWAALYHLHFLQEAGLDIVYDGEARRIEMYEYPIRRTGGFRFHGLVRSFDNKYYRKAASVGEPHLGEPYHLDEYLFVRDRARKAVKVPLTGAYTLADWSYNEYYLRRSLEAGLDPRAAKRRAKEELTIALARDVIRPNIAALVEAGATIVQIDEPAATTHPDEIDLFVESFNESVAGLDAEFPVHICFSDYSLLFPEILEMKKCSQLMWEFANRDNDNRDGYKPLELFAEYDDGRQIGLGVVDVHVGEVESPELVRDRILHAARVLGDPGRIYVNPDCGLRTRTLAVAFRKLQNMVAGAELARAELS
jgi:5-methyltetrahydropteroyltriglutamate--homocysteine methyltransferase